MRPPVSFLLLAGALTTGCPVMAQSTAPDTKPYATLNRQAVTYRGPIGTRDKDSSGEVAVIGAILPLQGVEQTEGKALLTAAQVAVEEEQVRGPLPDGLKLALRVRDSSGPWGQASSEILKLIEQDHAVVLLTSADGNIAHQAEQIANKISFPILTLASDPATTATNVPWVFRFGPSDTDQARAFCHRIYVELRLQKVLVVAERDHDGRVGSVEFEKAARELQAPAPVKLDISASASDIAAISEAIRTTAPDAVVVWTDASLAKEVVGASQRTSPSKPVFLCTKAGQLGTESPARGGQSIDASVSQNLSELFTVTPLAPTELVAQHNFEQQYQARTGGHPGIAAFQAYEAVHLIAAGLRAAGASRVLLREYFANEGRFHESTGIVPFDPAGNCLKEFAVVPLAYAESCCSNPL